MPKRQDIARSIYGWSMCLILMMSMFSVLSFDVYAQESEGLSDYELEILEEIYDFDPTFEVDGEFVSISKDVQYLGEGLLDGIGTRGAIGDNYMTIYTTVSRVNTSGKDTFNVTATAKWKMTPMVRMQDGFAISWGKDFTLNSSSIKAWYKSVGLVSGKTSQIAMKPDTGIGYAVEASDYYGQSLDYVRIYANISHSDRVGSTNLSAQYAHSTFGVGGMGLSIGSGGSFNFSFAGTIDTMSAYKTFSY